MLDLLLRRKTEVLHHDIRETLAQALRCSASLDVLFELSDARDALVDLTTARWDGPRAHGLIHDCETLLRRWDKAA